jgi:maltooligosyltrehalose trehalohydrolase
MGTELLKVGAALVLLAPFVPMLFQGEEWGASTPFLYFTDHRDPELGRAVSEGRRREHPMRDGAEVPDPQGLETFLRSKLCWPELGHEPHRSLLDWHRRVIALRRDEPDLSSLDRAAVSTSFDEELRWLVVRRGRFSIVCNLATERQVVPLAGGGLVTLASDGSASLEGRHLWLASNSVAVVAHAGEPATPEHTAPGAG